MVAGGDDTQKLATSLAGPTFRKKWSIGPRRCPMLAVADAEAAAALRELGATLKASTNAPKLHTLKLLNELGLDRRKRMSSS